MANTYGWKGIERGVWDSRKFVRYEHPDYPEWQVYRPEGTNRPNWPYCLVGENLPPRLQRGFRNFEHIHQVLSEIDVEKFLVSEVYHDLGFVKVFYEEYTGQDYESKSVKKHADVYQYVVTGMDAVNSAIQAAQEA